MNWEHLRAFLWLNSRIRANKSKRMGGLSLAFNRVLLVLAVILAVLAFAGGFMLGLKALAAARPTLLLFVWDGIIAAFMFIWLLTLSIDLQRSELMPLEKFLHYPVSISGLFLINFIASIMSERIAVGFFIPGMLGISMGLIASKGAAMLWLLPLLAAFLLMVTAVTHQFRGWLAVLMMNKRHRRTVITLVTVMTMLLFQLPNLSRFVLRPGRNRAPAITSEEQVAHLAQQVSMILPVGWLPYGAMSAAEGRALPPLLGIAGMTLIGALSLRRSYRTTLRLYTGNFGSGRTRAKPLAAAAIPAAVPGVRRRPRTFLEYEIPGVGQQSAVVALATFRSLTRAPEVKMALLSPFILLLFFGGPSLRLASHPSLYTRPLIAMGAIAMILLSAGSIGSNQFAYDRSGFRNYVLACASRRDILLGKNLSLMPVTMGMASLVILLLQWFFPMRIDHFFGVLFQMISMNLLFFLYANMVSIYNPMLTVAGSMRPAVRPTFKTFAFGMLTMILFPIALAPSMLPLGIEAALNSFGYSSSIPIYFLLSMVEAVGVYFLYLEVLKSEGRVLQRRELKILEIVSARAAEG